MTLETISDESGNQTNISGEVLESERREKFFNELQVAILNTIFPMPHEKAGGHATPEGRMEYAQAVIDWIEHTDKIAEQLSVILNAHGRLGSAEEDWSLLSLQEARAKALAALEQSKTMH